MGCERLQDCIFKRPVQSLIPNWISFFSKTESVLAQNEMDVLLEIKAIKKVHNPLMNSYQVYLWF